MATQEGASRIKQAGKWMASVGIVVAIAGIAGIVALHVLYETLGPVHLILPIVLFLGIFLLCSEALCGLRDGSLKVLANDRPVLLKNSSPLKVRHSHSIQHQPAHAPLRYTGTVEICSGATIPPDEIFPQ